MFRLSSGAIVIALLASPAAADEEQPVDPSRDQIGLTPTAWMHPTGAWSFTSFMVIAVRLAAAVHPRWQIELSGLIPNASANVAGLAVSYLLHEHDGLRVVARTDAEFGVDHKSGPGLSPSVRSFVVRRRAIAGGAGLVSSACFGSSCRSSATLGVRQGWSEIDDVGYPESGITASVAIHIGRPILFGLAMAEMCNRPAGCYGLAGYAGGGIRFAGIRWGFDLGLMKLLADKQENIRVRDFTPAGSPWFSVTYRSP